MRMHKAILLTTTFFATLISLSGSWTNSGEDLLQQAKLAMFDQRWDDALGYLHALQKEFPESSLIGQSFFYEARALEKKGDRVSAIAQYERFIQSGRGSASLLHEAKYSVVRMSTLLYQDGEKSYLDRAYAALNDEDPQLRFVTAIQLSYIPEARVRQRAVPILQSALENSKDSEIQNQASLALLRIDPKLLDSGSQPSPADSKKTLHLLIIEDGKETFRIRLPVSLTRMLVAALPDEARDHLRERGLNPENLLDELSRASEIIEIGDDSEKIRLWIE